MALTSKDASSSIKSKLTAKEQLNYLDQLTHTLINKQVGYTPPAWQLAILDWLLHFNISPGTQSALWYDFYQKLNELLSLQNSQIKDPRFTDPAWELWPFKFYKNYCLLLESYAQTTIDKVPGVAIHHKLLNQFMMRQMLTIFCPVNHILTNPEILACTKNSNGENLIKGCQNFYEDCYRNIFGLPKVGLEDFKVGQNLAITPGKIVFRNYLIELIQYLPTTNEVYKEPILIVPACIMKYYILDLSAKNSLVKYLVSQGHTVFIISWKNPDASYRDVTFDDYIEHGVINAITAVNTIVPNTAMHCMGYCLGGTMLAIAAAYMASKLDQRIKTLTLLAAQVDFKDAGELLNFIDESQITMLKASMESIGYLDGKQMAAAFNFLHSQELIWGKIVQDYYKGDRKKIFDIMAWNADVTRLPAKMHTEYLEKLFLHNQLSQGEFTVKNQGILLNNLKLPIFAVGTVADHVAPWRSVYKINFFTSTDLTFVLTTGGHNAGIVSEPDHPNRSYQIMTKTAIEPAIDQALWQQLAPKRDGSWWLAWQAWLKDHSSIKVCPPMVGNKQVGYNILGDAPGTYVLEK